MLDAMTKASQTDPTTLGAWMIFRLAKLMYRSELGHSEKMKNALLDRKTASQYRSEEFDKICAAANRYGIELVGKDVLDLGCNDGSITHRYLEQGARSVVGVDIDEKAIERARTSNAAPNVSFTVGALDGTPLDENSLDVIISYDVMEHVARPREVLKDCYRIIRPGGQMLIGTWGWYHPFAPHLWSVMPVPWAHVLLSEKSLLQACRMVYHSPWYQPNMHDYDESGTRKPDKYTEERISSEYLNKMLICDFEKVLRNSGLEYKVHLVPFGSRIPSWTRILLWIPFICEFLTGYLWMVLKKPV